MSWTTKKTWVLVANASVAKFYEFLGFKSGVQLVETREHPESRLPTRELITDNLPFPGTGGDKAPHTGEPPVPPRNTKPNSLPSKWHAACAKRASSMRSSRSY